MLIDDKEVVISGGFARPARLRAEYFECVGDPYSFLDKLKEGGVHADLFTFLQEIPDRNPRYDFHPNLIASQFCP